MSAEYSSPYKDPVDRTPEAEAVCKKQIEEYLQREGIKGYVLGPTKYGVKEEKPFILGLAILDPQKDHPEDLRFFVTPMEKLQFRPQEEDLTPIVGNEINIEGKERRYRFEIKDTPNQKIPTIRGSFSFDEMELNLE
jgi:hypothetical protein